jgi:hypothetical protein
MIRNMKRIPSLLSKTKLMRGYRCLKCIYLTVHRPQLEAPITPETQALFDQGNAVGEEARRFFPEGVLVDKLPWDFSGALAKTQELIASGATTIFEAAFSYMGCYARADIIQLSPTTKRWQIYEVKSTTKVKPEHIDDVGLQAWIMAKSGLPLEQINIMHLNTDCRFPDLSQLFTTHDVTAEIRETYLSIKPKVAEIFHTIKEPSIPDIDIGSYCLSPTECGFMDYCWKEKNIPELSVFDLPGLRDHKWDLYYDGITTLDDPRLADRIALNELQERIINTYKTKQRFVDHAGIKLDLSTWTYPLIFLDFETINPAIPRYNQCGPYHHVPFQFSVHIWKDPEAEMIHREFLHETADDPRPSLIPALLEACGEEGPIVAYYGKFEAARIEELANLAPEYRDALQGLIARIVDPLPIFRQHVYDNAFNGSFSLKNVAPALLGREQSYENMLVANGGDAQRAFEELISPSTSVERKAQIKEAMLEYCKKDTYVMVLLVKWLYEQAL